MILTIIWMSITESKSMADSMPQITNIWRWLPTAYALAQYIGAPKPVKQRVDPADTGLGQGLQLVATDEDHPFNMAYYRHRFGLGVGNRLNGVALQFVASTSYSTPSGFSH